MGKVIDISGYRPKSKFVFESDAVGKILDDPRRWSRSFRMNRLLAETAFQNGLKCDEESKTHKAKEFYKKALSFNPYQSRSLVNLGTLYFYDGRLVLASLYYEKAIELDPNYPMAHYNLARVSESLYRFDLAYKHYKETIRLNKNYYDAYYNLAELCESRGDWIQALLYWWKASRCEGSAADFAKIKSKIKLLGKKALKSGWAVFRKII